MTTSASEKRTSTAARVPAQRDRRHQDTVATPLPAPDRSRIRHHLLAAALICDLAAIVVAEIGAALGRHLPPFSGYHAAAGVNLQVAAPVIAIGWIMVIALFGGYDRQALGAGTDEFKRIVNASVVTAGVLGVGCYLTKAELSRGFFDLALLGGAVALLVGRLVLRRAIVRARRRGHLMKHVLVAGTAAHVDEVVSVLTRDHSLGYHVLGAAVTGLAPGSHTPAGTRVLGTPASLLALADETGADSVLLAGGAVPSAAELRRTSAALERSGRKVILAPSITDISRERIKLRPVGGLPLIHVGKPQSAAALARAKRTFDIVGSGFLILALSPVLAFAAFKVWRFDGGSILFRQERIGTGATPFACFKFRTMVVNAEARLFEVLAAQGAEAGLFAKLKDDPRITKPGKWMRRYSIDELPQLFNVFRGEMSLIGPRPQVAHEVAQYDDATARRLRVRPGMTGLWQVSGRSNLSVEEAIRLDLYYVDNWSMWQDLSILARTLGAVVGSDGAY